MNIRLKIIGMAVIIVILSAIGGSWVVYDMLQAEKRFAYYADVCWPATDMIMETNVQQQDILREVFEADRITDKEAFIHTSQKTLNELKQEWEQSVHQPNEIQSVQAMLTQLAALLPKVVHGQDTQAYMAISRELSQTLEAVEAAYDVTRQANAMSARSILHHASVVGMVSLLITAIVGPMLAWLLSKQIVRPIHRTIDTLKDIAQGEGDLTQRIDETRKDELGELGHWFNQFISNIQQVVRQAVHPTNDVASAADQIAATSQQMATGMTDQAQQASQISSAVEQMSASTIEVARQSHDASENAQSAGEFATNGSSVVQQSIDGMNSISLIVNDSANAINELGKRSEQIGQIINVINDIADQTNLLALNAAIEAARAGEHGRGFAVVADEVRKLAERTTTATEEVAQSIQDIQTQTRAAVERISQGTDTVEQGVQLANQADDALKQIVNSATQVAGMIQSIASAAQQQSTSSELISQNITAINSVTQQSAEGTRQTALAAEQLSERSTQLKNLIGHFKVD